jgi:nucleotide-binding universal stress UspA family protein
MFTKILLPLDGSGTAEQALFWAKQYAKPDKALVVLLQVLHVEYPLRGLPFRAGAEEATRYLIGIERELNFAGIPTKIILRSDSVSRSIVDCARQERCDLILMTSRGASKVVRWLIGGVTQQVMRLSPIPVLIVRSLIAPRAHERPRRILIPQDGSSHARAILPWARRLAVFHRSSLVLLHVATVRGASKVPGMLSRQLSRLKSQGITTTLRLEKGDPAEEILKACRPGDLLAITTHGYGGIKRLILGSVAEKVIHLASVPVLIYKRRSTTRGLPHDLADLELFNR